MFIELKQYKYTCDLCKAIEIVSSSFNKSPDGWESKFEYSFDINRNYDYCAPCCKAKRQCGEMK